VAGVLRDAVSQVHCAAPARASVLWAEVQAIEPTRYAHVTQLAGQAERAQVSLVGDVTTDHAPDVVPIESERTSMD
jgi:hypothetical protein